MPNGISEEEIEALFDDDGGRSRIPNEKQAKKHKNIDTDALHEIWDLQDRVDKLEDVLFPRDF